MILEEKNCFSRFLKNAYYQSAKEFHFHFLSSQSKDECHLEFGSVKNKNLEEDNSSYGSTSWTRWFEKRQSNISNGKKRQVTIWGYICATNVTLKAHGKIAWSYIWKDTGEKLNKCNQCDYALTDTTSLRQHLKTHSGEEKKQSNVLNVVMHLLE